MAQRQWRSDDTDKWLDAFGSGSAGDKVYSTNTTMAHLTDYRRASFSGTEGQYTGTCTTNSFTGIVMIMQFRGTNAGKWELNKVVSVDGSTYTLKYPLCNTYTEDAGNSQAQMIQLIEYDNITINSGVTLTAEAWDGNVGGIVALIAKNSITVTGNINATGKGFLGGRVVDNSAPMTEECGEGTIGARAVQTGTNGNGGGGGNIASGDAWGCGGGGGNGTAGTIGNLASGGTGVAGAGGLEAGTAALTTMVFGGGGGAPADWGNLNLQEGGSGGGIILLIGKTITVTGTLVSGGGAGYSNAVPTGGGGGAGGSILLKGKTLTLGSNLITAPAGATGYANPKGVGGVGRIHADYSVALTGTTTPTIDSTLDITITDAKSGSLFFNQL